MQVSRHWRMNAQRYRLEGVRYSDDTMSLQHRPMPELAEQPEEYPAQEQQHTNDSIRELQKIAS